MKYISTNIPLPTTYILTQEQLVVILNNINCPNADVSNNELLTAYSYAQVPDINTTQPTSTSIVVANKNNDGEYYLIWAEEQDIIDLKRNNASGNAVRKERNKLLFQTDWTQCKDVSNEVSTKWVAYRQALRDITTQAGFPDNITWPVPPK